MISKYIIITLFHIFLLGQGNQGSSWIIKKDSDLLTRCKTKVIGICDHGKFDAEIELTHVSGSNETFGLNLIVPSFTKYTFMDWDQFDPWESNNKKKMLIIRRKKSILGFRTYAEGRFTDSNTFMFDNTTLNLQKDPLYKMLREAANSSDEWEVIVVGKKSAKPMITIQFSFVGAHEYLKSYIH